MVVFMIVGKSEPLYEIEINKSAAEGTDELAYLHQFILFSSLDMINSSMWTNSATLVPSHLLSFRNPVKNSPMTLICCFRFLRVVDKFNFLLVSAFATQGGKLLLLLHNGKNEDAVRAFFIDVHELYVKYLMNPFVAADSPITSPQFDGHVRTLAKRYLA